ncbi:MAG: hypothetical protein OJF51_002362 [Nitrospira sp.]|jgi:hypothetical protein|nr:MAG: hypothetical protein OJF51_002362 [Nitrospira sp.]
MLLEAMGKPFCYRWPGGEIVLIPGHPRDLPEDRACRLLEKMAGKVRVVEPASVVERLQAGVWVEWLSPALPKQQGEVLAVYQDSTFEVFHPLAATLCRLPIGWVIRVLRSPINPQGSARQMEEGHHER